MRDHVIKRRQTWRTATAAAIIGIAVLAAATGAQAHDDEGHGWRHRGRYFVPPRHVYFAPPLYYYTRRPMIVYPPPVCYPPPVYYTPRPMVVYPAPGYYEPDPVYYPPAGLTINIPLR
jgi:hypothetical protein